MSRIHPIHSHFTDPKNKKSLEQVRKEFGQVPNFFLTLGNSPATLEAFLKFREAQRKGDLAHELQDKMALTAAATNDCSYFTKFYWNVLESQGLSEEELRLNLQGLSLKKQDQAILQLVKKVIQERGKISDEDFKSIKQSGIYNGQIIQVFADVYLQMFTHSLVQLAQTLDDMPEIPLPPVRAQEKNSQQNKQWNFRS